MVPVLFIIFNRPDTTARVFEAIRQARPARLYVAADGPRPDRLGEVERCEEARRIAAQVDWPCELHTLFQNSNLGCGAGPATAITWFFDLEAEGIILEDDCLPDPTFFPFCAELLARYRDEPRMMLISGNNFQPHQIGDGSYYISQFGGSWGWATWRRAWALYDKDLTTFSASDSRAVLRGIRNDASFIERWSDHFQRAKVGAVDAWDYQWLWTCWRENGLSCVPGINLVSNIGFGPGATHTLDASNGAANAARGAITFPLHHPAVLEPNTVRDDYQMRISKENFVNRAIRKILPPGLARMLRRRFTRA